MESVVEVEKVEPIEVFPLATKVVVACCCQVSYGDGGGCDVIVRYV